MTPNVIVKPVVEPTNYQVVVTVATVYSLAANVLVGYIQYDCADHTT